MKHQIVNINKTQRPQEIPSEKTPHGGDPLQDDTKPGKNNPVNPNKDEPLPPKN